jgi:hypothetical protein
VNINASAQKYGSEPAEQFGRTLNVGAGVAYYGYADAPIPVLMINYEFDIARNITLAPFVGLYSYSNNYYWGNDNNPYRNYAYRETAVPVGVKGAYYFDELLHTNPKWDIYAAASIGFEFRTLTWENGYYGDRTVAREASPLYLAAHVGARYHITPKTGIFLDLSTGFSTFGFSFKL